MVVVEDARRGLVMGFLTKEFTLDRGRGPEAMVAVYVPTNHLYLGDVRGRCRGRWRSIRTLSVEDGIRIFLTGGMALPEQVQGLGKTPAVRSATRGAGVVRVVVLTRTENMLTRLSEHVMWRRVAGVAASPSRWW